MDRSPRMVKTVVGFLILAFLIYVFVSWVRSLGGGASATGPGARQSRTDYGENGEPGSGRGTGDLVERPDAAARTDRGVR